MIPDPPEQSHSHVRGTLIKTATSTDDASTLAYPQGSAKKKQNVRPAVKFEYRYDDDGNMTMESHSIVTTRPSSLDESTSEVASAKKAKLKPDDASECPSIRNPASFLTLPREIRDEIYYYAGDDMITSNKLRRGRRSYCPMYVEIYNAPWPNMLAVNRQVEEEYNDSIHRNCTVYIEVDCSTLSPDEWELSWLPRQHWFGTFKHMLRHVPTLDLLIRFHDGGTAIGTINDILVYPLSYARHLEKCQVTYEYRYESQSERGRWVTQFHPNNHCWDYLFNKRLIGYQYEGRHPIEMRKTVVWTDTIYTAELWYERSFYLTDPYPSKDGALTGTWTEEHMGARYWGAEGTDDWEEWYFEESWVEMKDGPELIVDHSE